MSEYANAVLELPVAPERREAEREAIRLFKKRATEMGRAIARDQRLTSTQRLIGLELVAGLNAKVGYSWPSQETIAQKVGCSKRTVQRATDLLADPETGLWFRRELDGANYCYFPRFERLNEPRRPVDNRRHFRHGTGDISGVANVTLYSLRDSFEKETLTGHPRSCCRPMCASRSTGWMTEGRSSTFPTLTRQSRPQRGLKEIQPSFSSTPSRGVFGTNTASAKGCRRCGLVSTK